MSTEVENAMRDERDADSVRRVLFFSAVFAGVAGLAIVIADGLRDFPAAADRQSEIDWENAQKMNKPADKPIYMDLPFTQWEQPQ